MADIIFRNKLLKESSITTVPSFFKIEDIPDQDFSKDIDAKMHDTLVRLNELEVNSITIPLTVTENFLEFTGLRLGHHIRLSTQLNFNMVPLIFIGTIEEIQLLKLSRLSHILLTPNVYYVNISNFSLDDVVKSIDKLNKTSFEFIQYLEKITIESPDNYDSHHSIDNELSLLRWSEYIGCAEQIPEVKNNLQAGLYFKYTKALNPVKPIKKGNQYMFLNKAKILLIDDQSSSGWAAFYEAFFKFSGHKIQFEALDLDFKSMQDFQIIEKSMEVVSTFKPDVILLDLRLCDSDFDLTIKPSSLSGNKILKKIKSVNRGIQVIVITASDKVWNYEETLDLGANAYVVKSANSEVFEDIKNLKNKIDLSINRASYLIDGYESKRNIIKYIKKALDDRKIEEIFYNEFLSFLKISMGMFEKSKTKENFSFAYLSLFKCLELIGNDFVLNDSGSWIIKEEKNLKQYYWDNETNEYASKEIIDFRNNSPSTFEKITGICFQLYSFEDSDIKQIYYSIDRRNKFIHPSNDMSNNVKKNLDKIYCKDGFVLLLEQLEKITYHF